MLKIAVIQFPGSNCERETRLAIQRVGMEPIDFLWNESPKKLDECDGFVIIGGFSYEDRSRAGVIASKDPVMEAIKKQAKAGKPVLGICNGAQILIESGLVPGCANDQVAMVLDMNKRIKADKVLGVGYFNAWVHLRKGVDMHPNAFTSYLTDDDIFRVPIAHAQGRFVMPPECFQALRDAGLIALQYCDAQGEVRDVFPINPNGSMANIAAITNYAGNVMAMMPHPERVEDGDHIFSSMRDYLAEGESPRIGQFKYSPQPYRIQDYQNASSQEWIIDFVITDNQAMSVEIALNRMGVPAKITRHIHWEIECPESVVERIKQSDEIFNRNKEFIITKKDALPSKSVSYLVRQKEDFLSQQKMQLFSNHFEIDGIKSIKHGVLWHIEAAEGKLADVQQRV
ncbi:MAG: phosphoribosylformylglycinamidine synthase I, partial [Gammaproteobacteria bacterium]